MEDKSIGLDLTSFEKELEARNVSQDGIENVKEVLKNYLKKVINFENFDKDAGELLLSDIATATEFKLVDGDSIERLIKHSDDERLQLLGRLFFTKEISN